MGSAHDWPTETVRQENLNQPRTKQKGERSGGSAGFAARASALAQLQGVLDKGRLLEESAGDGDAAARAQSRALADLTLRRLNQIDDLLARFLDRPPKAAGQHILRLMAAELVFNHTSPHAAVDIAVRLAKSSPATRRLAGLINAVGRRLAEQGADIVASQDAAELAMPAWLKDLLVQDWGPEVTRAIAAAHLVPAPHDLTLKTQADAEALAQELRGVILPTGSLRLQDRPQISALPGYAEGAWWVQDAAAAVPATLARAEPSKRVLDLCAAPGGKTMQLAATGADVTALDVSQRRLKRLAQNLDRTGLSARTVAADALKWKPDTEFDAIVLDAPCSATGTIRRHPDLPHRAEQIDLEALLKLQQALLRKALGWLAPGGTLIYCTCSLLRSEGESQIEQALQAGEPLVVDPITEADGVPAEMITDQGFFRSSPHHWNESGGIDGFFAARLTRQ